MNIAYGKIGQSIYFNPEDWKIRGGNHEAPSLLLSLAQLHPDWNFYIIGKVNYFEKWKYRNLFPNIFYVWSGEKEGRNWTIPYKKLKNIHIDFGLFYAGQYINDIFPETGGFISTIAYASPILYFLNETNIPYFLIGEDPTYLYTQSKLLTNLPKAILTTQDIDIDGIKGINVEHDKWFLSNEKRTAHLSFKNRDLLMNIFTNWKKGKIEKIIDYVLKTMPETMIYGDWITKSGEFREENYMKYRSNFNNIPMYDMNTTMFRTKYTIMLSHTKGWRSASKFWKMLLFGIIPFFIPGDDDEHLFKAPEYLYVSSVNELQIKIKELERNTSMYNNLWYELQNMLKDEYFNGVLMDIYIVNIINKILKLELDYSTKSIDFKQSSIIKPINHISSVQLF